MGKYADMLGLAPEQTNAAPAAGGKYAAMLGLTPQKPDVGNIEGAIRGAADTATFGLSDEIEGFARGVFTDDTIQEGIDKARERHEASPGVAYTSGQIGGAFIPGIGTAGAITRAATTGGKIAKSALVGAGSGAVYGAGSGEGLEDRISEAATGAVLGAPLGAAGGAIVNKLTKSTPIDAITDAVDQIPLTKGQRSGDLKQIQKEEGLRKLGGRAQDKMQRFADEQGEAIGRAADEVIGAADDEALQSALQSSQRAFKSRVDGAYDAFRAGQGVVAKEAIPDLAKRFDDAIEKIGADIDVEEQASRISKKIIDKIGDGDVTVKKLDELRRSLFGGTEPKTQRAMSILRGEFDGFLDEAVTGALFKGDQAVVDSLKQARALNREYKRLFSASGSGDSAGRIIERMLKEDATPRETVNAVFGASQIGLKGTTEAIRRIKEASPEAAAGLKQAAWQRLIYDQAGDMKTSGKMVADIKKFVKKDPYLAQELMGADALKEIKRFSDQVAKTVTPKDALNPSHTAWSLFRGIGDRLTSLGGAAAGGVFIDPTLGMAALLGGVGRNLLSARSAEKAIRQAKKVRKQDPSLPVAAIPTATSVSTLAAIPGGDR